MRAIAADILTLEVDNVLCVTAEYTGRLVLLEDDMIAVNVDFQSVLYFDAHSAAQLNREHDATKFINLTNNTGGFHFQHTPFLYHKKCITKSHSLGMLDGRGEHDMLSVIWTVFLCMALLCGAVTGRLAEVTAAVPTGASEAITLAISITGLMCFWSGVMELLQASGLAERLSRLMAPVLRPLFGSASQDKQAMEAVSANVTANLLGLSNAATPLGLRASERLYVLAGRSGAPDTVLTLIVLNATSIQLIPSTVAAVRAACGAHAPFDIMLPVWGASAASVAAVLLSSKLLRPFFPDGE